MTAIAIDLALRTPPTPSSTDVVTTAGAGTISVTYVGTPAYVLTVSLFSASSGGSSIQGPFTTTFGNSTTGFSGLSAGTYYVEYKLTYTDSFGSTTGPAAAARLAVTTTNTAVATTLDDLADVTAPSPSNGQVLTYSSGSWVASTPTVGATNLDGLSDVTITSPTNGQALRYDSATSQWKAQDITGLLPSGSAGEVLVNNGSGWVTRLNESRVSSGSTSSTTSTSYVSPSGITFGVVSGQPCHFRIVVLYNVAATTCGTAWALTGPTLTKLAMRSVYADSSTTDVTNRMVTAYDSPGTASAGSATTDNLAILEGFIVCWASGIVQLRFMSETGAQVDIKQWSIRTTPGTRYGGGF